MITDVPTLEQKLDAQIEKTARQLIDLIAVRRQLQNATASREPDPKPGARARRDAQDRGAA